MRHIHEKGYCSFVMLCAVLIQRIHRNHQRLVATPMAQTGTWFALYK